MAPPSFAASFSNHVRLAEGMIMDHQAVMARESIKPRMEKESPNVPYKNVRTMEKRKALHRKEMTA